MSITVIGLILIPLSLLWFEQPIRLLQLAIFAAMFEAAAALVLPGNFGLQPAMVPGLLFVAYVVMQYGLGMRYPGERQVLWTLLPLFGLFGYALLSIFLSPYLFQGRVLVWPQRPDLIDPGYVPLTFTSGNVTQTLYLAMNVVTATGAALLTTRIQIPYRSLLSAYLLSGYVAIGLAFWQFAARMTGIYFPWEIIQSNPGWAIVKQMIGSVPRIQGTFSEPAAFALYLSGLFFCCLWLSAQGYRIMRVNLLLGLSILAMMVCTSTTGILTLVAGVPITALYAGVRGDHRAVQRLMKSMAVMIAVGVVVVGPLFILKPSLQDSVDSVYQATISKGDSDSYRVRSGLDDAAVATIAQTDGLGVGWGSFRSSSLIPGLLANGGLFGTAMAVWLAWRIGVTVQRGKTRFPQHPGRVAIDGFVAALCGQLVAAILSVPALTSLSFFLQLGCVTGTAARMALEVRRPGQASHVRKYGQRATPQKSHSSAS